MHRVGVRRAAQRDAVFGFDAARSSGRPHGQSTGGPGAGYAGRGGRFGCRSRGTQILAGCDAFDLAAALRFAFVDERAHVHDAFALLAGDLRPVVGVRRVRQVLVLAELLLDGIEQVVGDRSPRSPPAIVRLIESFFARRTMFSIMAPDEKSLKKRSSLSPFW